MLKKNVRLKQRLTLSLVTLVLSFGFLAGVLAVARPTSAAPAASDKFTVTLPKFDGTTKQATCALHLNSARAIHDFRNGWYIGPMQMPPSTLHLSDTARNFFYAARDDTKHFVTMTMMTPGADKDPNYDPTKDTSDCAQYGVLLIQDPSNINRFYGFSAGSPSGQPTILSWLDTTSNVSIVQSSSDKDADARAVLNPSSQTIDFYWAGGGSLNYKIQGYQASIISNGASGGTGSPGTCPGFSAISGDPGGSTAESQLQKCIDQHASTAYFKDFAHIEFAGAEFTLNSWSGGDANVYPDDNTDQFRYTMTKGSSSDPTWLNSASTNAYLDLDTSGGYSANNGSQADLNIDNGTGGFAKSINAIGADSSPSLTLKLVDNNAHGSYFKVDGGKQAKVPGIDATHLPLVALYYGPKSTASTPDTVNIGGVIAHVGSQEQAYAGEYTKSTTTPNTYVLSSSKCAADSQKTRFVFKTSPASSSPNTILDAQWVLMDSDCQSGSAANVQIRVASASDGAPANVTGQAKCTDTDSNGNCLNNADNTVTCGGGDFDWLLCPFIDGAMKAANKLDSFITGYLDVDVSTIFDHTTKAGSPSAGYYTAWNSFRVIATALLVIGGLVMVASQALGFEFLDAYTIRKVLPRILVAVIGISLSWPLMRLVVSFFDTAGIDIRQLMYGPFSHLHGNVSVATSILSTVAVGVGIMALGWASLTFILTALMAVFIGFMILIIRQVAIVMLIILAPIGIACYILPNTQKGWKLWSENFMGLMLMFPIISALIAAGHIFSAVTLQSQGGNSPTSVAAQGVAIVAYIIPYFLLPLAARLATGVIGNLAGVVNDRGKGVFDRLKKKRSATAAERFGRAQSQSLYDNNNKFGRIGNKLATWATDPVSNAAYYGRNTVPGLKKRGLKVAGQIEHAQVDQSTKLFEELNKAGYNDKAYRALSGAIGVRGQDFSAGTWDALKAAGFEGKAPKSVAELQQVADILARGDSPSEQLAANAIHGSMGRLATLYQDPEMGKASIGAAGIMGLAAHGFASADDLAAAGNSLQRDGGAGFAQSIVSQSQVLGGRSRPDAKAGYGIVYEGGKFQSATGHGGKRARQVIKSLSSHDMAGAKGGAFDTLAPTMKDMLSEGGNEARAVQDQLFSWAGPYSQASVDIKAKALQMIQEQSASDPTFAAAWARYQRQEDPDARRGGASGPEMGGGGSGAGGGGFGLGA